MGKIVTIIIELEGNLDTLKTVKERLELAEKIGKLYTKVKLCPRCEGAGMVDRKRRGG